MAAAAISRSKLELCISCQSRQLADDCRDERDMQSPPWIHDRDSSQPGPCRTLLLSNLQRVVIGEASFVVDDRAKPLAVLSCMDSVYGAAQRSRCSLLQPPLALGSKAVESSQLHLRFIWHDDDGAT